MKSIRVCMLVRNDVRTDYRVLKEATSLAKAGYRVTVVGANFYGSEQREQKNGVEIIRVSVPKASSNVGKAINLLPRMIWQMVNVAKSLQADIYHAHDSDTILPAWLAMRSIRGAKLIYDAHEVGFIARGLGGLYDQFYPIPTAILTWCWNRLNDWIVHNHTDRVITVTNTLADMQEKHYAIRRPSVVMNCPKKEDLARNTNKLRERLNLPSDTPIIICHGMYSMKRGDGPGLTSLIKSAPFLHRGVVVIIGNVGVANEFAELRKLAQQPEFINKVFILPTVPPTELLSYTAEAFVGVIPLQLRPPLHLALPNKFFEYLGAGVPVLTSDLPEVRRICDEYRCGVFYDPSTPQTTAEAINQLMMDPLRYQQMQQGAQRAASIYNWEQQEKILLAVYHEAIGSTEVGT